jgi:hypothetical protein
MMIMLMLMMIKRLYIYVDKNQFENKMKQTSGIYV